jgi:hypothetical protein
MGSVRGLPELQSAISKIVAAADDVAREIVVASATIIEAAAKRNFQGSHAKGQPHVGGNMPNVVTGTLRRSIHSESVTRIGFGIHGTRMGPSTVYGRRVELGFNGSRGYAYFTPAIRDNKQKIQALARERWAAALARKVA